jgi:hypothetical protein
MDNPGECQFFGICERLGTKISACATAAVPKNLALEEANHRYRGDAQLARISLIEEDVDRLRACVATIIKLLA